jgi:hypothetical protein
VTGGERGGRTCGGMTRRILEGSLGVPVEGLNEVAASEFMVLIDRCDEPDVGRSLGAILTSVFVVKRSASPFDCGSRETAAPNPKFVL